MTEEDDPVELDQLYAVRPGEFTALRRKLVAAAKKRGDAQGAKRIAAAHRPTTAAWVANTVVRCDATARTRLRELSEQLRAAHATMDGVRIRELSSAQRKLIEELARAGFAATGLAAPSAALRDDVVGTLQAAIAEPEVAARLGQLAKAERWSGFGEFGAVAAVGTKSGKAKARDQPVELKSTGDEVGAAKERVVAARNDVESAAQRHAAAVDELSERSANVATARRRYEKILDTLGAAEGELNAADADRAAAERAAHDAADSLETMKSLLADAESNLSASTTD